MKKKTTIKLWSMALCTLVIGTQIVTAGATGTPSTPLTNTNSGGRVRIIGIGWISSGGTCHNLLIDCVPLCILVIGQTSIRHIIGPHYSIDLLNGNFLGFYFSIGLGLIPTPIIGTVDTDAFSSY